MIQSDVIKPTNTEVHIEDDIVVIKTLGEVTRDDLVVIFDAYFKIRTRYGRVFALYDGREGKGMASDARKEIMDSSDNPDRQTNAVAVFGAPFAMRILVNMLDRALVGLRRKSLGVTMFATETEARAFLAQQRQLYIASNGSTSATQSA